MPRGIDLKYPLTYLIGYLLRRWGKSNDSL